MTWSPTFRLIRPDDLVVLDVQVSGLEPRPATPPPPGGPTYFFEISGPAPEIWVQFAPQQIIEYAKPEGGVRKDQPDPLFVDRTDLIFTVTPADLPIPATVEGLLAAMGRLALRTVGGPPEVALAPAARRTGIDPHELVAATAPAATDGNGVDRARAQRLLTSRMAEAVARRPLPRQAVMAPVPPPERPPSAATGPDPAATPPTAYDRAPAGPAPPEALPALAALAATGGPTGPRPPDSRIAMPRRLAVRLPKGEIRMRHAAAPVTSDGRTELWHSQLVVRTSDSSAVPAELAVPVRLIALPNTAGVPLNGPRDENAIRNAIFDVDCRDVAPQTNPPYVVNGQPTTTRPARVGRLMVSALGGWLQLQGSWPTGVKELRVDTAQGRDQFQRKVVTGRLIPFGHRVLLTSTSVRRFETGGPRAAALQTTTILQVLQPVVDVDAKGLQAAWPFSTVEILHPEPISGAEGSAGSGVSTFEVGGLPFFFQCRGIDRSGQAIDFELPMLFARDSIGDSTAFAAWRSYAGIRPDYVELELGGQRLGVAVAPSEETLRAEADAGPPISPTATTVLAQRLRLALDSANRPVMGELHARVEALERFAPGTGAVALQYAEPYLDHLLEGANREGQVFLQFAKNAGGALAQPVVGLGGQATAGLADVKLPMAGLSRRFGAVAGELPDDPAEVAATLGALADGDLDLGFLTSTLSGLSSKLLGLVDFGALIQLDPKPKLDEAQSIVTDALDGVTRQTLTWNVGVLKRAAQPPHAPVPLRQGFISLEALAGSDPHLTVVQVTEVDATRKEMRSSSTCEIDSLALKVYMTQSGDEQPDPDEEAIVTIPFERITFTAKDGSKADIDVVLGQVQFGGILRFVRVLADVIDSLGLSDPPALEVTSKGVRSSFSFDVPAVAVGMFALENIAFSTALDLVFSPEEDEPALLLTVGFARRTNPFRLTVGFLGGGGSLVIAAGSQGLALIEGSISFGASLSVRLGFVASASVEAMGGIVFTYSRAEQIARLTGFLQIRGEAHVLSLVHVSVTLLLELSYDFITDIISGHAEVVVEVSVWFFSQSVTLPYDWQAKGGNSDPTFAELMAPEPLADERPWDTYCMAFAED